MATGRRVLIPLVAVLVGLTACSCDGGGDPAPAPPTTSAAPSTTAPPEITTAAGLGRAMRTGAETISSATVELSGSGPAGSFSGDGPMTLSAGRVTAVEVFGPPSVTASGDRIRIVAGAAYVRPDDIDGTPQGKWQRVTASNPDPTATKARGSAAAIYAIADLVPLADSYGLATTFEQVGPVVGGMRYSVDSFGPTARLGALGDEVVVPTSGYIDVDETGRPLSTWTFMTVDGAVYSVKATWTDFDEAVSLEPPAPSEIAG